MRADPGRILTAVYTEHSAEAFRYALHLTGRWADAEDIVQQVFLLAHRHLESGRDLVSPRPWLLTAVRHRAFNLTRGRREIPLAEAAAAVGPREPSREDAAELAQVRGVLWTLPEAQHQAFVLRHWSGLSQTEIAEVLDTTPAAVESLLVRARSALLRSHESASETCSRVRRRLLDAASLGTTDDAHVAACRSCRQARARLARAANLAGSLALVPGTHVAESLARVVPGFSAHVATSTAAAAGTVGAGSGGATATWGTTAVTTAGKMTVVAKAAAAVVAATAVVGAAPSAQHAVSRLIERDASAHRPAPARTPPTPTTVKPSTHAPLRQAPAVPMPGGSSGHAPAGPGKHPGNGNGHGKPADPGDGADVGKANGHAPAAGGNGEAIGRPAGTGGGGHGGGKPAGAGGGKPVGAGGGNGNAGGHPAGAGGGKPAGAGKP